MRRLLAQPTWRLLVLLVGVSAALRAWAADAIPRPWIHPDELIYTQLGRELWHTGHLTLFGEPRGFYSLLYPALVGPLMSLGDPAAGYRLLQALQALLMSLAAIPTYFWARRLATREWALLAAVFALVPPGLAYSGLVMTEVAFYPAFVLASFASWNALGRPTPRAQVLALVTIAVLCSVRLQGFGVGLAYATAACVDRPRLRAHVPALAGLALLTGLWSGWQLRHGGPLGKVFGAYQAAAEVHYRAATVARFVLYDVGDLVLIAGVVPVLAVALLARERGSDVRAYVVFVVAATGWTVLQVAAFASVHVGNPAERNLFALIPLFAVGLAAWLSRGAPRSLVAAAAAAAACAVLLVAFPFATFASLAAAPSNFTLVPLYQLRGAFDLDLVVPLAAAATVVLAALAPRAAVALVVALGLAASIATSRFVAREAKAAQLLTLGADKPWIDAAADRSVAFVYSADVVWETVWANTFWNRRLRTFYDLRRAFVPGGLPQRAVGPRADGHVVFGDGRGVAARYAVTRTNTVEVAGTPEATSKGLTLWRVAPPFRLVRWVRGLDTSSEALRGHVVVDVFACRRGRLHVGLRAPVGRTIRIFRSGTRYGTYRLEPNVEQPLAIPVRPTPSGLCRFTLAGDGPFVASGLIVF